jgi:hypothetical protein
VIRLTPLNALTQSLAAATRPAQPFSESKPAPVRKAPLPELPVLKG